MKEQPSDATDVRLSGEKSVPSGQVNLMGGQQRPRPQQRPQQEVQLNPYQKKLLEALSGKPDVTKLLGVIFRDYAQLVRAEFRQTAQNATPRQRRAGQQTTQMRLQVETFIEEEVCKLAGINTEELLEEAKKEHAEAQAKK